MNAMPAFFVQKKNQLIFVYALLYTGLTAQEAEHVADQTVGDLGSDLRLALADVLSDFSFKINGVLKLFKAIPIVFIVLGCIATVAILFMLVQMLLKIRTQRLQASQFKKND